MENRLGLFEIYDLCLKDFYSKAKHYLMQASYNYTRSKNTSVKKFEDRGDNYKSEGLEKIRQGKKLLKIFSDEGFSIESYSEKFKSLEEKTNLLGNSIAVLKKKIVYEHRKKR